MNALGLRVLLQIKRKTLFIRLDGELDQSSTDEVRLKLIEVIEKYNLVNVVFNMQNLTFMDSSGIGIIIGRYNQIKNKDGQVVLCNLNDDLLKIVRLSGLLRICTIKDNEDSAKYYLGEF